ncbi:MAG: acyltransferase [Gemmatimonadetes bacterium]|nr:acyltransferase [Gemmatimonadota bacterium]
MPFLPLRPVPVAPTAEALYDEWLAWVDGELNRPDCDRNELCRTILTGLYYPQFAESDPAELPMAMRLALAHLDPRNVTLEPEYYQETDVERYATVKPLLWLWEMFDRSPVGENVELGIRFRRILARRIFKRCGRNFKAFTFVRFSFGYNMEVGDDVVIHRHVLMDDRGGIEVGDGASVSDFANVYSHTHDIVDGRIVHTPKTIIGNGVRITYHATILAGMHVADDSMVGAGAILTKDTRPHWVFVGIPARPVKEKAAEERAHKAAPTDDPFSGR